MIEAPTLYRDNPTHAGSILLWQTLIHLAFIVSAIALAAIDKMSPTKARVLAGARRHR